MAAVTPIRSLADTYGSILSREGGDVDIGRLASGGYGIEKRKQFIRDLGEICRLAKIGERADR